MNSLREFSRLSTHQHTVPKCIVRINKEMFFQLCGLLEPHIPECRYINRDVSVQQKILATLRFYATGCYQRSIGEGFNLALSQTSVHRYIHEVTNAIEEHICPQYIRFPVTRREMNEQKETFMNRFNFPGIVGVIDGTHIAVLKPKEEEHAFINRKGFHSLNAQIVCDANLKILFLNANFPGSSHDSFIWRNSQLREFVHEQYTMNNFQRTWLIGDSGYPLEPFLMTPIQNAVPGTPEARYNAAFGTARNCVERCIGVLKSRFRCLSKERVARYDPRFVGKLMNVCSALHNMCINFNLDLDDDIVLNDEDINPPQNQNVPPGPLRNEGLRIRNNLVVAYFN